MFEGEDTGVAAGTEEAAAGAETAGGGDQPGADRLKREAVEAKQKADDLAAENAQLQEQLRAGAEPAGEQDETDEQFYKRAEEAGIDVKTLRARDELDARRAARSEKQSVKDYVDSLPEVQTDPKFKQDLYTSIRVAGSRVENVGLRGMEFAVKSLRTERERDALKAGAPQADEIHKETARPGAPPPPSGGDAARAAKLADAMERFRANSTDANLAEVKRHQKQVT